MAEDAERQQLVDLAAVEQVARALRCDLGMVGQDDRRRQDRAAVARLAGQHRPGPDGSRTAPPRSRERVGRVGQRHEARRPRSRRIVWVEQKVGRSACSRSPSANGLAFEIRTVTRKRSAPDRLGRASTAARQRAPAARRGCPRARRAASCSSRTPRRRDVGLDALARLARRTPAPAPRPPAPSPRPRRRTARPSTVSSSTGSRPFSVRRATRRSTTCRNRTRTSSRAPAVASARHCVCITQRVVRVRGAVALAGTRRRRSSAAGSSAPSGGRATARSPRRARRRRSA